MSWDHSCDLPREPAPARTPPRPRGRRVLGVVLAVVSLALVLAGVLPVVLLGLVLALNGGQLWSNK